MTELATAEISQKPATFDPAYYANYFERNSSRARTVPQAEDSWPVLSPEKQAALANFVRLAYQGEDTEGQMGSQLLKLAENKADARSLDFYFKEEAKHARELLWLAQQLNLELGLGQKDIAGKIFDLIARYLFNNAGFGDLLTISNLLMVGEVSLVAIYREVANKTGHPLVKVVFSNIIRDEAGHINYHGSRIKAALKTASWLGRFKLKLVHSVSLLALLLPIRVFLAADVEKLTGLPWKELIEITETTYNKCYSHELSSLRAGWVFKLLRHL